jgi:hypothetical protein
MFLIVVAQKRAGAGLRYLRAWCRLLQAYGTEPRWIAQAVGDEGNAWLAGLEKRGEIETGPKVGSDLVVECLASAGPGPADAPGQLGLFSNPPRGDDRLRDLERQAAQGDRQAAVQLDVARYRAGAPSVLGWLVKNWSTFDAVHEDGRYTPAASVLGVREEGRQKGRIDDIGFRVLEGQYWSHRSTQDGWVSGYHVGPNDVETAWDGPFSIRRVPVTATRPVARAHAGAGTAQGRGPQGLLGRRGDSIARPRWTRQISSRRPHEPMSRSGRRSAGVATAMRSARRPGG